MQSYLQWFDQKLDKLEILTSPLKRTSSGLNDSNQRTFSLCPSVRRSYKKKSVCFTLINSAALHNATWSQAISGTAETEGLVGLWPYIALPLLLLGFIFQASDGAQMKVKWLNTDLNLCLYWPDFQPYHFKMVSAVPASSRNFKQCIKILSLICTGIVNGGRLTLTMVWGITNLK